MNASAEPAVSRMSTLGAAYTCHVTNGMTSDTRRVRLQYDVIGGTPLSWMSVKSVTGKRVRATLSTMVVRLSVVV